MSQHITRGNIKKDNGYDKIITLVLCEKQEKVYTDLQIANLELNIIENYGKITTILIFS